MGHGLVAGIGAGVVIIFVVWLIAIVLCCFAPHEHGHFTLSSILGILFASIVTITLISLPRSPEIEVEDKLKLTLYDEPFTYRLALVIVMGLSLLAGIFLMVATEWSQQNRAKPFKTF
uniref:Transmembrane protein 218 n=1 Tax=Strigamia maritima TaxID=126957 RepID=T1J6P7_STRMM